MFTSPITYDPPIHVDSISVEIVPTVDDQEKLLNDDLERLLFFHDYTPKYISWREILLSLREGVYHDGKLELELSPISSYNVQAYRANIISIRPTVLFGTSALIASSDGYLMFGKRTSPPQHWHILPAGYMTYHTTDPLRATIRQELKEETGLSMDDLKSLRLIGHGYAESTPLVNMLFFAESRCDSQELRDRQRAASHAFEHSELLFVRDDPNALEHFLENSRESLMTTAQQCIRMRIDYLKR